MRRVLLIEDYDEIRNLVHQDLRKSFEVVAASSLAEADDRLSHQDFDIILLDVKLPDGNGFEFCESLKSQQKFKRIPVIFLTGIAEGTDKARAFSIGADDYIVKPFDSLELTARIEARLRNSQNTRSELESTTIGHIRFDLVKRRAFLTCQNNVDINLTPFEFKILYFLASRPGQVFTRDNLLEALCDPGVTIKKDNIYTHISSLRKKLLTCAGWLESVPGLGYTFRDPDCGHEKHN